MYSNEYENARRIIVAKISAKEAEVYKPNQTPDAAWVKAYEELNLLRIQLKTINSRLKQRKTPFKSGIKEIQINTNLINIRS